MRITKSAGNPIHMEGKAQNAKCRRLFVWIFMGALVCVGSLLLGQTQGPVSGTLGIGFTSSFFVGVNASDGLSATKVWADAIVKKKSLSLVTSSMVFGDLLELEKAVKEGKADMVTLLTREYLSLEGKIPLEPYFVPENHAKMKEECLLLVHDRSGIRSLEELAKKNILISDDSRVSLGKIWLENILMGKGYVSLDAFFGKVSLIPKPSQALLPVFFQQADACLINKEGFETMVELNPQLKRDLRVIAQSPAGIVSIICIRSSYKAALRQILIESLQDLHVESKGQQILTLFKVEKLIPFEPSYLESARQLVRDHRKLEARVKGGRI
jgi:ABC-type phosphate/phosphonate transport system substrate-binding protein